MRREHFIYLALFLVTAAVYQPVWHYKFINFDDWENITGNAHVREGLTASSIAWAFQTTELCIWHPITWMSWMLDYQLFGLNAGAFHVVNLLFHIINSLLVFHLLRQMTGELWPSAIVAALFAVHPLNVESVAWVTGRKDTLSTFFGLLSIWAYCRYADPMSRNKVRNYLLALLFLALGLMSKPILVTWPFVLLLLDFWPLRRFPSFKFQTAKMSSPDPAHPALKRLLLEKLPFLALSIASSVVALFARSSVSTSGTYLNVLERSDNALMSYAVYLSKTFWPRDLAIYYPLPDTWPGWQVVTVAVVLLLITVGTVYAAKNRPFLVFGWVWFLGMLVPVIGLVAPSGFFIADRYMYVPSIGIFVMIVWGAKDFVNRRPAARLCAITTTIAALLCCLVATGVQLRYWRNTETLFRHAVAVTRPNAMARHVLGKTLADKGQVDEGLEHLNEALRIDPTFYAAHASIAEIMLNRGNIREAINHYREALRYMPGAIPVLNNLAWILATNEDPAIRDGAEAMRLAESACSSTGFRSVFFIGTLAAAYAEAGRFEDAVKTAEKACALAEESGAPALLKKNRELLELYRAGHAYREPLQTNKAGRVTTPRNQDGLQKP